MIERVVDLAGVDVLVEMLVGRGGGGDRGVCVFC